MRVYFVCCSYSEYVCVCLDMVCVGVVFVLCVFRYGVCWCCVCFVCVLECVYL